VRINAKVHGALHDPPINIPVTQASQTVRVFRVIDTTRRSGYCPAHVLERLLKEARLPLLGRLSCGQIVAVLCRAISPVDG
jgi:hypothetical protein